MIGDGYIELYGYFERNRSMKEQVMSSHRQYSACSYARRDRKNSLLGGAIMAMVVATFGGRFNSFTAGNDAVDNADRYAQCQERLAQPVPRQHGRSDHQQQPRHGADAARWLHLRQYRSVAQCVGTDHSK